MEAPRVEHHERPVHAGRHTSEGKMDGTPRTPSHPMPSGWSAETLLSQMRLHLRLPGSYPHRTCNRCQIRKARTLTCFDCMERDLKAVSNPAAVDEWISAQSRAAALENAIVCVSSPMRS